MCLNIENRILWNIPSLKLRLDGIYNQFASMKFLAIIAAALLQVALSAEEVAQTQTQTTNAKARPAFTFKQDQQKPAAKPKPTVPKSIANSKPALADKLSHLSPEQLEKFNELREAQKNFKASLKTDTQASTAQ